MTPLVEMSIVLLLAILALRFDRLDAFSVVSNHVFSAQSLTNGPVSPDQVSTQIQLRFDHGDMTAWEGQDSGFIFDISLADASGASAPAICTATFTARTDVLIHPLIGTLASKQGRVTSVVTEDRNSYKYTVLGNVIPDPNIQSLLSSLTSSNGTLPSGNARRRLLSQKWQQRQAQIDQEQQGVPRPTLTAKQQETFARTQTLQNRYFSTSWEDLQAKPMVLHPEHIWRMERQAWKSRSVVRKAVAATRRRLLDLLDFNPNDPNPVVFSPSTNAQVQNFLQTVSQVMTTPGLVGAGSVTSGITDDVDRETSMADAITNRTAADAAIIQGAVNLDGPQLAAYISSTNASAQALVANEQTNFNMTVLASNQTNWIVAAQLAQMQNIANQIVAFGSGPTPDPFYNASLSLQSLLTTELDLFNVYFQAQYQQVQGFQSLLNAVRNATQNVNTLELVGNALKAEEHQTRNTLIAAGYQPVMSTQFPAPQPLGRVSPNKLNVGYQLQLKIQRTSFQSQQSSVLTTLYDDVDMDDIPNYQSQTLYQNLIAGAGTGTSPIFYNHLDTVSQFFSSDWILKQKRSSLTFYDPLIAIGPSGCTPNVNCDSWVVIDSERCATSALFTTTNIPPVRNHVFDAGGCLSAGETNSWWAAPGTNPSLVATQKNATRILTSVTDLMTELQRMCRQSLQTTDQTTTVPTGPYNPFFVAITYGSQIAPVTGLLAQQQILNNFTYCGTAPQTTMDQSFLMNNATLPYLYISALKLSLEGTIGQVGESWSQDVHGGSDVHVDRRQVPFSTPDPATSSGSGLQRKWLTDIAYTATWAVPIYHMQRLGTTQTLTLDFTRPGNSTIIYSITLGNGALQDITAQVNSNAVFPYDEFYFVGFLNVLRALNGGISPDPPYFPSGINYLFDLARELTFFSNITELNEGRLSYFADLRASNGLSQFSACPWSLFALTTDPRCNLTIPQYNSQFPPPVWQGDDWAAYYSRPKVSPLQFRDSLHWYAMPVTIDAKGELDCAPRQGASASTAGHIRGVQCQWLATRNPYGFNTPTPDVMDEYEFLFAAWREWHTLATISIPGTLIASRGATQTFCPTQPQMSLRSTSGAWVTLYIQNPYAVTLNMTVTFNSTEAASCNNQSTLSVGPGAISMLDMPFCQVVSMVIQSFNPTQGGFQQLCWSYVGNITLVFQDEAKVNGPTGVLLATENSTVTESPTVVSGLATTIVSNADLQMQLNLYTQAWTVLFGSQLQIGAQNAITNYMISHLPPASASTQSITLPASQAVQLGNLHSTLMDYTNQVTALLAGLVATNAADAGVQSGLNANVLKSLEESFVLLQNASATLTNVKAQLAAEAGAFAEVGGPAQQANLQLMENSTANLDVQTHRMDVANASVRWFPPSDNGTAPDMPWNRIITASGSGFGWGSLIDFAEAIGLSVVALVEALVALVYNPNCFLGLTIMCTLADIWHYILIAIIVIVVIIAVVICCTVFKQVKGVVKTVSGATSKGLYEHVPQHIDEEVFATRGGGI